MSRLTSQTGGSGRYIVNNKVLLNEADRPEPKEYFVQLVSLIRKQEDRRPFSLIDVGCAAGTFLNYASKELPLRGSVGVDVSPPLLRKASVLVPGTRFYKDSILSLATQEGRTYDVCTCLGVISVFDDLSRVLRRLLTLVRPGGSLWVFDIVNPDPVDVLIRFRRVSKKDEGHPWQKGLNCRSLLTWKRLLREIDPSLRLSTWDFEMTKDLPKTKDSMRSWTALWKDGRRQVLVGTGQLLNFKFLRIRKPGRN